MRPDSTPKVVRHRQRVADVGADQLLVRSQRHPVGNHVGEIVRLQQPANEDPDTSFDRDQQPLDYAYFICIHSPVWKLSSILTKAVANLRKHKVGFSHAEQVLRDPLALTVEDPDAQGEQRQVTLGMDALGRLLVVVHTQRGERTRLISARKASPGESEHYHHA